MPKVKLNFERLSVAEKIARARVISDQITKNAASFPTPFPTPAELDATADALELANNNVLEIRAVSKQRTTELNEAEDALSLMVSRMVNYVENASGGKEDIIQSAGMDVRAPNLIVNEPPALPSSMTATMGDQEGEIDVSWNATPNAQSYILQTSPNPPTDTSWTQTAVLTASKHTVKGLTSGTKYWFRVAAVSAGGQSGWSDPAVKMAP